MQTSATLEKTSNPEAAGYAAGSVLWFATLWALLVTALAGAHILLSGQGLTARTAAVVLLYLVGSFAGAAFARAFSDIVSRFRSQPSARFAAMFLGLSVGTLGMTALIHFLHFRSYYAGGHSDALTLHWFVEMIFTGAQATYIFVINAAQTLLPWGLALLLAASWDYAMSAPRR